MRLVALRGPNFSGRSRHLRDWVGLPADTAIDPIYCEAAYVGLDPTANLSGLAPTARAEIELLAADASAAAAGVAALEQLGFGQCLDQNPFSLSGGEQVVVAVVAAVAGRPKRLAIDCALEQLSPVTRSAVVEYLARQAGDLRIADNRLGEWYAGPAEACEASQDPPRISPRAHVNSQGAKVELIDLGFAYVKHRPVFAGLNLTFEPGQLYVLKGANGSGKSTLSKILAGVLRPTSGEIRVDGKSVQPWKRPGTLARYHFQDPDLQLFSTRVSAQLQESPDALAEFGLADFADEHPLDLPYVLRKRLAIAAAVAGRAALVALDEPTLGQDDAAAQACRAIAVAMAGLVISHSRVFDGFPEICLEGAI